MVSCPVVLATLKQGLLRHAGGDKVMAQVLAAVPTAGLPAVLVAVELVVESGVLSAEHVENVLARLNGSPVPASVETSLQLQEAPVDNTSRYESLRATGADLAEADHASYRRRTQGTALQGMVGAWADLTEQDEGAVAASQWLIEHLLQAEHTDRAMRSVTHQMFTAKFPLHRDLAGFDFTSSKVDQPLVRQLATLTFTDTAQNVMLIGGPGTGKTHLATAMAVSGIATQGKWVRFYSTVDLVNVLEREKRDGKAGQLALSYCAWTW
jgi:chromosomal replication initiation ATPase DnaA